MSTWPSDNIERKPIKDLIPYARNSRTHSDEQVAQIAASIKEWGFTNPILTDEAGMIIAGHGRVMAAQKLGIDELPVMVATGWTEAQKQAYVIADNKLALNAGWDDELLKIELGELDGMDFDLSLMGFDTDELADLMGKEDLTGGTDEGGSGSLAERFLISPFSVLNAREGWWQNRKCAWLARGIKSEIGREDLDPTCVPKDTPAYMAGRGNNDGGSIFDPVLCELAYTWFSPPQGLILDPFAGGSVRGIVAAELDREYIGVELRGEQVEANRLQAAEICEYKSPAWVEGDSMNIDKLCAGVQADMIFSCPPYADLEVYSDDPADLSNMPYDKFIEIYRDIIAKSCSLLKDNSFACFVVGDIRDKKGNYRNFVGDTVEAFRAAGLEYYNEAILVTAVGSLPIRVTKQFNAGRKLGKTHQNILGFIKGEGKKATINCGPVEVYVQEDE